MHQSSVTSKAYKTVWKEASQVSRFVIVLISSHLLKNIIVSLCGLELQGLRMANLTSHYTANVQTPPTLYLVNNGRTINICSHFKPLFWFDVVKVDFQLLLCRLSLIFCVQLILHCQHRSQGHKHVCKWSYAYEYQSQNLFLKIRNAGAFLLQRSCLTETASTLSVIAPYLLESVILYLFLELLCVLYVQNASETTNGSGFASPLSKRPNFLTKQWTFFNEKNTVSAKGHRKMEWGKWRVPALTICKLIIWFRLP